MDNKNRQNCSLIHPHHNTKRSIIDDYVNKHFFQNLEKPDKFRQMAVLKNFEMFQEERFSRGYGMIGFKILIQKLSNQDLKVVENSLLQLKDELKKSFLVEIALHFGINEKLKVLTSSNFEKSPIPLLAFNVINLLCRCHTGAKTISQDEELIKSILTHVECQSNLSVPCAEILQTLSENPYASQTLLYSKNFITKLQQVIQTEPCELFFSAIAKFIAMKPDEFAKIEILKLLIKNVSKSAVLKCLALILNCSHCQQHAIEMEIEKPLLKVLVADECDDDIKTYAIMAMRNYLTYKNIVTDEFPWKRLLKILIEGTNTKINELLQETCIQTLRVMSDVRDVKDCLRKIYLKKLRDISPITARSKEMKRDLLEWLNYKNYKVDDNSGMYSNLLI